MSAHHMSPLIAPCSSCRTGSQGDIQILQLQKVRVHADFRTLVDFRYLSAANLCHSVLWPPLQAASLHFSTQITAHPAHPFRLALSKAYQAAGCRDTDARTRSRNSGGARRPSPRGSCAATAPAIAARSCSSGTPCAVVRASTCQLREVHLMRRPQMCLRNCSL